MDYGTVLPMMVFYLTIFYNRIKGPRQGIEPWPGDPQSPVLPLHHSGHCDWLICKATTGVL